MSLGRPKTDRRRPECQQVDLDCQDCILHLARNLALVAETLSPAQSRSLFFTIFPSDECRSMVSEFTRLVGRLQIEQPARQAPAFVFLPLAEAVA